MIFATIDYIKYRMMIGKYSIQAIESKGARLCNKNNIENLIRSSKPLDVIFLSTRVSISSWAIMYYTNSIWSHTSTIVDDKHIVDVTTQGVKKIPISDYIDNTSYFITVRLEQELTKQQAKQALDYLNNAIGSGYNWLKIVRMFFSTVLGIRDSWRLIYSLDFYILFSVLYVLGMKRIPVLLCVAYTLILVPNIIKRVMKNP